jgi:hypothetical protein
LDMGGPKAFPVTESSGDRTPVTTYYKLDSDQASIVAFDLTHPMPSPMPILKLGPGKTEWDISGVTKTGPAGERLLGHGEARAAGQKTVLGKKVDVIEVRLKYEIGIGISSLNFDETRIYARGVGLAELTVKARLGKGKVSVSEFKIVSMELPKVGAGGAG